MQANGVTINILQSDALSDTSEGYVNDDEDISKLRSNHRQSNAPSDTSETYMDMSGRPTDMTTNSAYNVASSVEVPTEEPPSYEYIVTGNMYYEIPERVHTRPPPLPPLPSGPPPGPVNDGIVIVEEPRPVSQRKFLCSFWQGRVEIGLRATILILELLMLSILIAAFVNWRVISFQENNVNISGASLGTGFLAIPTFFFMIIVTVEEIIFLALRLCTKAKKNDCINCLLVWDIVNSTLVGVLFLLSTIGSAGLSVIWIDTVPQSSDAISGEIALFITTTTLLFITAVLCIVKTVWIPVFTYRKDSIKENSS